MALRAVVLALALVAGNAFVPASVKAGMKSVSVEETRADLMELAESMPGPPGFWDPLECTTMNFRVMSEGDGLAGNEATIGYLRHAEIKHGRVAMAGFLGFIAQCTPLVRGEHAFAPYRGYIPNVTPQEQWDNIPLIGKLQILVAIGMLESYGEGAGMSDAEYTHYMKGGMPGFYPSIKGKGLRVTNMKGEESGQITFDLYDPFNFGFRAKSAESRARGRQSEILNGRLAMIGLMGLLSESHVPGSVPFLAGIKDFPRYDGDVMAPFSHDFTILGN